MKKHNLIKLIIPVLMTVLLILSSFNTPTAYGASSALNGPGTVRAGDTITLTLTLSSQGSYGMEASLSYDSSMISLTSISTPLNGWKLEQNGSKLVLYDDALSNPLGSSANVLTVSFKVSENLGEGTKIQVGINQIITTDGSNENSVGNAVYTAAVAPPLSGNANLSALTAEGCSLTPAFNPDTVDYSVGEVDYSVDKLTVSATTADNKSSVSFSDNKLNVGDNTIYVYVKAENGASKTYAIHAVRKQDPNYIPDGNASLSGLTVSSGILSPAFSPDITEYIVYLPFGSESISASGTAASAAAKSVAGGSVEKLSEGINRMKVTVTAENNSTKDYNIAVLVMPEYNGYIPKIEGMEPYAESPSEEATTEEPVSESETPDSDSLNIKNTDTPSEGVSIPFVILLVILGTGAGFGICFLLYKKKILKL